jgi:hypothetical protein
MKPKRPTQRDPQKVAFSVALPRVLVADLERIADDEHRTRNGQIVHFLAAAVARHAAENKKPPPLYTMPEPDLDRDIAAEPPPPPYGQSQSQSQSQSQGDDEPPELGQKA